MLASQKSKIWKTESEYAKARPSPPSGASVPGPFIPTSPIFLHRKVQPHRRLHAILTCHPAPLLCQNRISNGWLPGLPPVLLTHFGAVTSFPPWRRRRVGPHRLDDIVTLDIEIGFLILTRNKLSKKTAGARLIFAFADDDFGVSYREVNRKRADVPGRCYKAADAALQVFDIPIGNFPFESEPVDWFDMLADRLSSGGND